MAHHDDTWLCDRCGGERPHSEHGIQLSGEYWVCHACWFGAGRKTLEKEMEQRDAEYTEATDATLEDATLEDAAPEAPTEDLTAAVVARTLERMDDETLARVFRQHMKNTNQYLHECWKRGIQVNIDVEGTVYRSLEDRHDTEKLEVSLTLSKTL